MSTKELNTALSDLDLDEASVIQVRLATSVASGAELLMFKKPAPPNQASCKRPLPPSALVNHSERLKRAKLALERPSSMAMPSQYARIQADPDQMNFDDRPKPDPRIAPIALLYPFYGEFHDIYAGRPLPDDIQSEIDLCEMEKNVVAFAAAMSCRYRDELDQRDVGNKHLNRIFKFEIRPGDIASVHSNGHSLAAGVVALITEWKDEVVGIKTFPDVQCVGHVTQSHTYLDALKGKGDVRRIPALGITIIGDLIQFNAIILLGHQLYRAFIAAHILQRRIHDDLDSYLCETSPPSPFTLGEYFFPAVMKIREDGRDDANKNHISNSRFSIIMLVPTRIFINIDTCIERESLNLAMGTTQMISL